MEINVTIGKGVEKTSNNKKQAWTDLLKDSSRSELIDQIIHLSEENNELKDKFSLYDMGLTEEEIKFVKPYTNEVRKEAMKAINELKKFRWVLDFSDYSDEDSIYVEFSRDVDDIFHGDDAVLVTKWGKDGKKETVIKFRGFFDKDDRLAFEEFSKFLESVY